MFVVPLITALCLCVCLLHCIEKEDTEGKKSYLFYFNSLVDIKHWLRFKKFFVYERFRFWFDWIQQHPFRSRSSSFFVSYEKKHNNISHDVTRTRKKVLLSPFSLLLSSIIEIYTQRVVLYLYISLANAIFHVKEDPIESSSRYNMPCYIFLLLLSTSSNVYMAHNFITTFTHTQTLEYTHYKARGAW